ncbi:alpha/beta-hydrolase [Rickenella mellea]|uniref:Alpha/beta-hydrolase n=1 Tax=Rickenella mellea TaxID=50990 RepID=A0A4Y7PVG9_9AGAM|nr:alpha/beta-hydrolase [Rickenella mellea]
MEPTAFKDFKTSRGINYHYYISAAQADKPTLLFLHGFPSSSYDWDHQVRFFQERGFGIIVPDLLGYGGTDKPRDVKAYGAKLMAQDMVDIIDHENAKDVIAVGHDWGSGLNSRLAVYHQGRFKAFAFLAVGFTKPNPDFDLDRIIPFLKKTFGSDILGYWYFLIEEDSDKVIMEHFDSFFSLLFAADTKVFSKLAPVGALKEWVLADKITEVAPYANDSYKAKRKEELIKGGLYGPTNWYRVMVQKITPAEERDISADQLTFKKPAFYGPSLRIQVETAEFSKAVFKQHFTNGTIVEFDSDHWVQLAMPEKVNTELLKWIESFESSL